MTPDNLKGAGLKLLLGLIPCLKIKKECDESDCKSCKAYMNYKSLCWTLDDPGSKLCREGSCRDCEVYRYSTNPKYMTNMTASFENPK